MPLQQAHIDELKTIYQKEYGATLDDKEAWAMAMRLINLFRILIQPSSEEPKKVRTNEQLPPI